VAGRASDIKLGVSFRQSLTSILLLSTSGQRDLDFGPAFFEVELERNDGERLRVDLSSPLIEFVSVHEEFALAIGIVTPKSDRVTPGWNVHLEDPQLAAVRASVTPRNLGRTLAQGLDLGADEHNAALEGLENLKVVSGTSIGGHDLVVARVFSFLGPSALDLFGSCHHVSVLTYSRRRKPITRVATC
jgi:hypothetical protein